VTTSASVQVLPENVRRHLAELAATVLGELEPADVPPGLARVRAFAPSRRARAGAAPIAVALEREPGFRQRVAAAWRAVHPDLAEAIDSGSVPGAADPELALTAVYLLRPPEWAGLAATLSRAMAQVDEQAVARSTDSARAAELTAAQQELSRLRELLALERERVAAAQEEVAGLRREIRKHRSDADRARAQARAATEQADTDRVALAAERAGHAQAVREAAERIRQLGEQVEAARRAEREGRSLADTRVRLLLDTVVDAAAGLRRELALPPADVRPADLVGASGAGAGHPAGAPGPITTRRGQPPDDPGLLTELLRLPQVHLVVDGYNVTKTGYGTLPLIEQRRRLLDGLTGLAARTGAEITCCFDGADVEVAGGWRRRGVRVLFSDPGVTADEMVRRLVRAEPVGRPVVVVSTDGEVVRGVRAAGAHAVPAQALLRLLSRS
jgi:predicted RNA-binding protein with PIN domain